MGLLQQIISGARFTRKSVSITNTPVSGSSTEFGTTYILLNMTTDKQCRVRLYSDSASVALDDARPISSIDFSASVGLVLDTYVSESTYPYKLNFDPPIFGTTFSGSQTWYNISGSNVTTTFTYYPIESSYATKQPLEFYASSLPTGTSQFGNLTSPKSFLILSASCNVGSVRVRLYSRNIDTITVAERARSFSTLPSDGSSIIADMIFDSASYEYKISPILQAHNLTTYTAGENYVGYIINNLSAGTISNVTASLYIYPIED